MAKRKKVAPIDGGLTPKQKTRLRAGIRDVWRYSHARKLCEARCLDKKGFPVCEECGLKVPKVQIDHIIPCGDVEDPGYLKRMFVSSKGLKALCPKCHKIKTDKEKKK